MQEVRNHSPIAVEDFQSQQIPIEIRETIFPTPVLTEQ